ncbi:unnamed protein product [Cuscuta europaea]|uniref:Uncharacterized protein n=1 Tax=Cuscuta europaea TaxID=41803 RepID=A0A9P1A059_CUSEU|nr:unnamed protein product [Cuscuta europaea]
MFLLVVLDIFDKVVTWKAVRSHRRREPTFRLSKPLAATVSGYYLNLQSCCLADAVGDAGAQWGYGGGRWGGYKFDSFFLLAELLYEYLFPLCFHWGDTGTRRGGGRVCRV